MEEDQKPTGQEEIEAIGRQVFRHRNADTLYIKRVPKETLDMFTKFADENFIGDYGFCLKWLMDSLVKIDTQNQMLALLQDHEARLGALEGKPKTAVKTMLSGRKIEIPVKQ
jgi:hypothetical protein